MEKVTNKLSIISHPDLGQVRSVTIKGEPYFIAKDLCDILGYANNRDAIMKNVYPEDRADVAISDGSQNRQMTIVNESGLYSLIMKSRLETAKVFQHWVTSEVLPAIRRQGFYVHPSAVLTLAETRRLQKVMRENVDRYIIAEDIRRCARKFGLKEYQIRKVLSGDFTNNDIMLDLQTKALANQQKWNNAYSVERMNEVTKALSK
ncbi:MAG: Bro-N domain-containing protein [Mucinivorans sp.]